MERWHLYVEPEPTGPFYNMGMDEALLRAAERCADPVMRIYRWERPAATFGLLQRYREVSRWTDVRPLIRRPTGGGLVLHGRDWTYSITIPAGHPWYRMRADTVYSRVHALFAKTFEVQGIHVEVALESNKLTPGVCFAGPDRFDLLFNGKKIAGLAMRRTRSGLLLQGSILPPVPIELENWVESLCMIGAREHGMMFLSWNPDWELVRLAEILAVERYASGSYNQRR